MSKAVDRGMVIGDVKLLEKSGGKSEEWKAGEQTLASKDRLKILLA